LHAFDRRTDRQTDGRTDGENFNSITVYVALLAIARQRLFCLLTRGEDFQYLQAPGPPDYIRPYVLLIFAEAAMPGRHSSYCAWLDKECIVGEIVAANGHKRRKDCLYPRRNGADVGKVKATITAIRCVGSDVTFSSMAQSTEVRGLFLVV